MAVTKREFFIGSFIACCLSVGFLLGAIGSQSWVKARVFLTIGTIELNYGLFQGEAVKRLIGTPETESLYISCNYTENVCLYSCKTTREARHGQIRNFLRGCSPNVLCNANIDPCIPAAPPLTLKWFNAALYVTTLVFLGIAILMATATALIGVYNTVRIPVEPLAGVYGLYIWNACAIVCNFIVLCLWGVHFETNLKTNLGYTDTMIITSSMTGIDSQIGVSYWLVLASLFCHAISKGLLFLRQWLIDREPSAPTITIDTNTDNTIFLY